MSQTVAPELAPSRRLLRGYFAGLGVVMAVWGARMPAVQSAAEVSTAGLALVLLAAAFGMVAGLQTGGRLAHLARLPALLTGGAVALAACLAVLGTCHSLASLLVAAAFAFGVAHGVLDVAANAAAVRCQDAHRRPIMAGLHASYSLGALLGAALAAVTAHTSHAVLFATVAVGAVMAAGATARLTRTLASAVLSLSTAALRKARTSRRGCPRADCGCWARWPPRPCWVRGPPPTGPPFTCTTSARLPRPALRRTPLTVPPWPQVGSPETGSLPASALQPSYAPAPRWPHSVSPPAWPAPPSLSASLAGRPSAWACPPPSPA